MRAEERQPSLGWVWEECSVCPCSWRAGRPRPEALCWAVGEKRKEERRGSEGQRGRMEEAAEEG